MQGPEHAGDSLSTDENETPSPASRHRKELAHLASISAHLASISAHLGCISAHLGGISAASRRHLASSARPREGARPPSRESRAAAPESRGSAAPARCLREGLEGDCYTDAFANTARGATGTRPSERGRVSTLYLGCISAISRRSLGGLRSEASSARPPARCVTRCLQEPVREGFTDARPPPPLLPPRVAGPGAVNVGVEQAILHHVAATGRGKRPALSSTVDEFIINE